MLARQAAAYVSDSVSRAVLGSLLENPNQVHRTQDRVYTVPFKEVVELISRLRVCDGRRKAPTLSGK